MAYNKISIKCAVLAFLILSIALIPFTYKKPIEKATFEELTSICGIGETRAMLVLESCADDVDDLYLIDGIGEKTVYALKQKYR